MDIQQHSGKQISQEFPSSTYQRSQEYVNYSIFPVVSAAEFINCVEEKQFPTTTTTSTNIKNTNNNIQETQPQQININNSYISPTNNINTNNNTINNNNNNNNKIIKKSKEKSPKLFEDVLIPVTSSAKDGSLFTVLENVPVKRTHRRRSANVDKDSLKCHQCNTSNTPEWRKGPEGPATLCNACGLAYAKKQKLGLLGQANKSKAIIPPKKNSKGTTTRSRVFNELVVPTVPVNFPLTTPTVSVPTEISSIKKSHTFHEYQTPLNSFYTGKPIKTTKTTTKQRSKSKIGKLIPSIHEQPQLNQQVQAVIEKNKLSNSAGIGIGFKSIQQQISPNSFSFNNSINSNNHINKNNINKNNINNNSNLFNNNSNNNTLNSFNSNIIRNQVVVSQNNLVDGSHVNSFSPTNNHENQIQFDFSTNGTTTVPVILNGNSLPSNIYVNEQTSYVPIMTNTNTNLNTNNTVNNSSSNLNNSSDSLNNSTSSLNNSTNNLNNSSNNIYNSNININNSSNNVNNVNNVNNNNNNNNYSNQYQQIISTYPNSELCQQSVQSKDNTINQPILQQLSNQDNEQISLVSQQKLLNNKVPQVQNHQISQEYPQSTQYGNNNPEVKFESSPVSEFGSSPTESFNGLTVNTPLNNNGNNSDCSKLLDCSTSANFNGNGDYFASMNDCIGSLFGINGHEDIINLELLPNSLL